MADIRDQISALMSRVRERGGLPSSAEIVDEAFTELGYTPADIQPDEVLARFDEHLRRVWEHTLTVLERHEDRSYAEGILRELASEYPQDLQAAERVAEENSFEAGVMSLFASWYPLLRRCFLSGRARAGRCRASLRGGTRAWRWPRAASPTPAP